MRNPLAERELAWAYEKGYGTSTNKESHAYWQLKAAESGQHNAQLGLGWAYMSSPSAFPTDYQKAMIWNVASFNNGNGEAAANIGLLYENGWGVPINYQLAADWYMRAINSDGTYSGQAEARLAWLYQKGLGLSQNVNEAKSLYEKILYRLPHPGSDWKEKAEYQLNLINKSR